jgi:GH15 family glucan-1,4-alpha-glucosidase
MCWVALDRLIRLHEAGLANMPIDRFKETQGRIRDDVEAHGYSRNLNSYVGVFDGDLADVSLLRLSRTGYLPADSAEMRSTIRYIIDELAHGAFLRRYKPGYDGMAGVEGAFGIACFWAVEALAAAGYEPEARRTFEILLNCANDVGLFAEEFDTESGEPLGNFPQAFTHVGLINAALALDAVEGSEKR